MGAIQSVKDNPYGLHQRYIVTKASGEPVDDTAAYFVLRLDCDGDDKNHIQACRWAAREYAHKILADDGATHLHQMANELHCMIDRLEAWNEPDEGLVPTH